MTTHKPGEAAAAAHERLFPGHVSTLTVTDPELIEYFGNFAFDEVLRHTADLPERTRLMTQLAAMIAVGAVAEYRVMLGAALAIGVTPVEAKEIVYQAHAAPTTSSHSFPRRNADAVWSARAPAITARVSHWPAPPWACPPGCTCRGRHPGRNGTGCGHSAASTSA